MNTNERMAAKMAENDALAAMTLEQGRAAAEAKIRRVLGPDAPLVGIHDCKDCDLREADDGGPPVRGLKKQRGG